MSKPLYQAFVVKNGGGANGKKKAYWQKIGVAFPHKDGKGLDLVLDGKLVLRVPLPKRGPKPAPQNDSTK